MSSDFDFVSSDSDFLVVRLWLSCRKTLTHCTHVLHQRPQSTVTLVHSLCLASGHWITDILRPASLFARVERWMGHAYASQGVWICQFECNIINVFSCQNVILPGLLVCKSVCVFLLRYVKYIMLPLNILMKDRSNMLIVWIGCIVFKC